ncbi:PH domain-containing protein [Streptomyces sp. NPDC051776]|uniref:PH domain-containing protein n=1 Tax=Streptomyces sp. NPDC051776 TaxID=3155414 RepID=UPI00341BF22F
MFPEPEPEPLSAPPEAVPELAVADMPEASSTGRDTTGGHCTGRDTTAGDFTAGDFSGRDLTGAAPGAAVPTDADVPADVVERRLHPVTPLRRAWAPIAVGAGVIVHDLGQAQKWFAELSAGVVLLGLAVLIPAAGAYGFLSWWFTHFSVTSTELRIRTGLVFRRTAHIRLDRLQAVDVTQPLFARFLGVAKLKLDVVGANEKDELSYLAECEARALRAELLARAAGIAPESAQEAGEAPVRELARVAPKDLAVSLLLMASVWSALVIALAAPPLMWMLTGSFWASLAVGLPFLGGVWAGSAGRFVAEYDWRLGESPDGLRLDHGLLDREHETVPPGRVQTVRIVEPLLWRRRGWVRVELDVAGSKNDVLLPVAEGTVAQGIIGRVLPGVDLGAVTAALQAPPRRARWCLPLWWRGQLFAADGLVFAARHGLLGRTLSLVPHAKVQSVRRTQGPWQRRMGLADVHVDTGAGKSVQAGLRDAAEASRIVAAQADRSRTGRHEALPDRWLTRG